MKKTKDNKDVTMPDFEVVSETEITPFGGCGSGCNQNINPY